MQRSSLEGDQLNHSWLHVSLRLSVDQSGSSFDSYTAETAGKCATNELLFWFLPASGVFADVQLSAKKKEYWAYVYWTPNTSLLFPKNTF